MALGEREEDVTRVVNLGGVGCIGAALEGKRRRGWIFGKEEEGKGDLEQQGCCARCDRISCVVAWKADAPRRKLHFT